MSDAIVLERKRITTIEDYKEMLDVFSEEALFCNIKPTDLFELFSFPVDIVFTRLSGKIDDFVELIRRERTDDLKEAVFKFNLSDEASLYDFYRLIDSTQESFCIQQELKSCVVVDKEVEPGHCIVGILSATQFRFHGNPVTHLNSDEL